MTFSTTGIPYEDGCAPKEGTKGAIRWWARRTRLELRYALERLDAKDEDSLADAQYWASEAEASAGFFELAVRTHVERATPHE